MSSLPPPPPPPPPSYSTTPVASSSPRYASFFARLGAHIIDNLLYGLLLAVFVGPAFGMGAFAVKDCERTGTDGDYSISCNADQLKAGLLGGAILLGVVGVVIVAVLYLRALGRTGQTWGRRIVGIRVVRQNSAEPLGFGLALGRCLLESILGQLCFLNYLWMLWDKDNQTWHDKIVHTVVVQA